MPRAAEANPAPVIGRHAYATAPPVEPMASSAWSAPVNTRGCPSIEGAMGSSVR